MDAFTWTPCIISTHASIHTASHAGIHLDSHASYSTDAGIHHTRHSGACRNPLVVLGLE